LIYLLIGSYSSLATTSSELESLRSAYKDLETKFAEADKKREQAEKQLAEKKSELLKKEADFELKCQADSNTLQKLQNEVHGLRKYMTTAEKGWDLLNSDVMGKNPETKESNKTTKFN
jgi:chromosome segregation ATPase